MDARRCLRGNELALRPSRQVHTCHAAVVEPEPLLRVGALVVELALIVDEQVTFLHLIEAAADPQVAAATADVLQLEILLMAMDGRRRQGLLAVIEAHVDEPHLVPGKMWLKDVLVLLVVNDAHSTLPPLHLFPLF